MRETMNDQNDRYFEYLKGRTRLGAWYGAHVLYPKLARRLSGRTLDIGCGIGDMLSFRPGTVGVDINPRIVAHCRSIGLEAHLMEGDRLPFDADSFDSVLMDTVLEHVAQAQPMPQEAGRVLVPGGRLLVGVPGQRGWDSDPDRKVYYDEQSLPATVQPQGFRLAEAFYAPLFKSPWLARRMRQYCMYALFTRSQ